MSQKNLTYVLGENNSWSNSLRESSASCEGLGSGRQGGKAGQQGHQDEICSLSFFQGWGLDRIAALIFVDVVVEYTNIETAATT